MSSTEPPNSSDSPRRRRSPLVVASVAVAVLVAGGGGAYFATSGFGGSGDGPDAKGSAPGNGAKPPPLSVGAPGDPGPGSIAPGEPDPSGGAVYKATGKLPEGPDKAAVHRARGAVTAAEVTRLAKALGVPGTPRLVGPAWKIGADKDGAGPLLRVDKQAPGTWTFARFGASPGGDNCLKGKPCPAGGPGSAGGAARDGAGTAVDEKAAKKAAAPVLKALDQSDADLDARQLMGSVRVVNADPVIDGLATYGWETGIQVGADGHVVGGSGQLKKPVKGDTYPVISADEALKRLNKDSRGTGPTGIGGCATAVPDGERKPAAPCVPKGKTPAQEQRNVGKAVFGLAAQYVDGQRALVPSWLFEVEPKGGAQPFTVAQSAVDPAFLKEPAPPKKDIRPTKPPHDPVAPSTRRIQSYSADGRTLSVTFWGGVCSDYAAKATESGETVKVAITETNPDPKRVCIAIAKELTEKVTLGKPLGDRKVVDAQTGEAVPRS
ncbi:hypothetical protein [Streptomyces sp. NBC_00829]|uniref:hypothetical protein n=1 Tax=Streptomyces sp. NBC_00829 TaxID=2903679 RepID=UPI0038695563|nr:hypothetical protein OG293_26835 [Streptomyces sp. NBC_00829]